MHRWRRNMREPSGERKKVPAEKQAAKQPEDTAGEIHTYTPEIQETDTEYAEALKETQETIISIGLQRLEKEMQPEESLGHPLPSTLVFCDTRARGLAYAMKPFIEKVYTAQGQALPHFRFLKTFRGPSSLNREFQEKEAYLQAQLEAIKQSVADIKKEIASNNVELANIKPQLQARPRTSPEYTELSQRYSQLTETLAGARNRIDALATAYRQIQETLQQMKDPEQETTLFEKATDQLQAELRSILSRSENGPVLVIDDVVSRGYTFRGIEQAAQKEQQKAALHYFSFLTSAPHAELNNLLGGRFIAGIDLSTEPYPKDPYGNPTPPNELRKVYDVYARGFHAFFPGHDYSKQETTGVKKQTLPDSGQIEDLSPRSTPYQPRNTRAITKYRKYYADIGKNVLARLEAENRFTQQVDAQN